MYSNNFFKPYSYQKCGCSGENNERFGGFLLPFLTGAAISAPFWYLGGVNRGQQVYYQPQPYPVYYPYYQNSYPQYNSYPIYR